MSGLDERVTRRAFPAHAGMNRGRATWCAPWSGVPRTRRDEPDRLLIDGERRRRVPRTRGDEPGVYVANITKAQAFPAHAGMNQRNKR